MGRKGRRKVNIIMAEARALKITNKQIAIAVGVNNACINRWNKQGKLPFWAVDKVVKLIHEAKAREL